MPPTSSRRQRPRTQGRPRRPFSRLVLAALPRLALAASLWAVPACGPAVAVADPQPATPSLAAPAASEAPPSPLPTTTPVPAPSATASPPISEATTTATVPPSATPLPEIELLFTGDINPGRCVYTKAQAAGDMALPYRPLGSILRGADLLIGSLDGTLSDQNPPNPCAEFHRNLLGPAAMVDGMAWAGYDVMAVATNHAKDCGLVRGCVNESLLDTRANLLAAGIAPVGTGANLDEALAPVVLTVEGVRFAFLAVTAINHEIWATETEPGAAPFKLDLMLEAVRRARAAADVVIVLPHWGREFSNALTYQQVDAAARLVEAGATLVVGNHPHRVQAVETFPNGAVAAYALGNFVFDMTWSDGTLFTIQGIMLRARFRGSELLGVETLPIRIHDDFQPHLADPADVEMIMAEIEASLDTAPRR
jgi:poly-gamma-glutamate synthesis protein (capsule biosynthesis protein)